MTTNEKLAAGRRLAAIEADDALAERLGNELAGTFALPYSADRYETNYGPETPAGVARVALRILLETEDRE